MSKPKYLYDRLDGIWYIYEMEYIGTSSYGTKQPEPYFIEIEAKKETYRLNGWEIKEENEIRTTEPK